MTLLLPVRNHKPAPLVELSPTATTLPRPGRGDTAPTTSMKFVRPAVASNPVLTLPSVSQRDFRTVYVYGNAVSSEKGALP